ncbi:hypothetical protein CBM2605_B100404 [Cupriavidus neocaledonicus]|uniref:Uncharacterized protein n=1 Tax=Cupriavidus neocaledonicus TaxID=1040979 RepID=A0ABY1V6T3_9BURK|nr:hypothetical protein CBM2605_B100404 [Cupriavidus neocaledonicus]
MTGGPIRNGHRTPAFAGPGRGAGKVSLISPRRLRCPPARNSPTV